MSRSQTDFPLLPVSWYLESLAGLPTWRGEFGVCISNISIFCFHEITVMDGQMHRSLYYRLMKAQTIGDTSSLDFMRSRRVLEINPNHPIIQNLNVRRINSTFCYF